MLFLPWVPPLFRPFITPVRGSINTRGLDTTFASCGAATGTLITSMRNSAVLGSLSGFHRNTPPVLPIDAQTMRPTPRYKHFPCRLDRSPEYAYAIRGTSAPPPLASDF